MKKYILIIAALFMATFANAQSDKEEVDFIQAAFGMDKKQAVAEFIKLTDKQKDGFWKVYDEYETKRKDLGKQRIELFKQYVDQYNTMTSEQADTWTKKVIELQKKTDNLIVTYYDKVKAVTDGLVATQFYQIESTILIAIRAQVLQNIPFVQK